MVLQEALEAEQADCLGRDRYERGERPAGGSGNGYEPGHLKTAQGRLEVAVPPVRGSEQPFRSRLLGFLGEHTDVWEPLAVQM